MAVMRLATIVVLSLFSQLTFVAVWLEGEQDLQLSLMQAVVHDQLPPDMLIDSGPRTSLSECLLT